MRLSGLQKEVLALYRNCLRESRKKPEVSCIHQSNSSMLLSVYMMKISGSLTCALARLHERILRALLGIIN